MPRSIRACHGATCRRSSQQALGVDVDRPRCAWIATEQTPRILPTKHDVEAPAPAPSRDVRGHGTQDRDVPAFVSRALPQQIAGLYHAGSVGIIMSGWLGAMNYGVIVANEVDSQLMGAAIPTVA